MWTPLPAYAELHCLSSFSFQRGASLPEELVARAAALAHNLQGWGNLCEFITAARSKAPKGEYAVSWNGSDFASLEHCEVLLVPLRLLSFEALCRFTYEGMSQRYPQGIPDTVQLQVEHELDLIAELKYEMYFLTVYDIVRFARERHILHQGRGSAANSAVCYCLGVTEVDP